MSTAYDDDRADREWCGAFDGWDQGDLYDPADHDQPAPLEGASEPVRVVGEVCGRPVVRRHHGSNFGPCFGRVTAEGGCDKGCVPR